MTTEPNGLWCSRCVNAAYPSGRWAIKCQWPAEHRQDWALPAPSLQTLFCTTCGQSATMCRCEPGVRRLLPVPVHPRQRSVVGTTLIVLFTVFVIAPILLIVGCSALFGVSS